MKNIFFVFAIVFTLSGCAAMQGAVNDISHNPSSFTQEATQTAGAAQAAGLPVEYPALLAGGYLIAFLRRVYVNYMKAKNKNV